jgi:uncharacterized protein YqjF (DUF2071 family)
MNKRDSGEREGRFGPVFLADWLDAVFIHFRLDPRVLRPAVPLELDLFDGHAYLSLVAFTQRRLRPIWGGRLTERLSTPLAHHSFLNLRTYVRYENRPAIFFLAEWITNRLAVLVGPALYGLPYRLGKLNYRTTGGESMRSVRARGSQFVCRASWIDIAVETSVEGSEAEFLLERYAAFTLRGGILRRFRIAHRPWRQTRATVTIGRTDLLDLALPPPCAAHYSPGVLDVAIGAPERMADAEPGWEFAPQRLTLPAWK